MITEQQAWSILFAPLASFLIIGLVIRPFLDKHYVRLSGYVTIAAIGIAFCLSLLALWSTLGKDGTIGWAPHEWLVISDLEIRVGILMDPLTAVMLVVVTGVSLTVQIYSQGYMRGDSGYSRYFAFMSLFTAAMVGIVLASNIIQLYVFWELVGLSSYLLIGFWYNRPSAAAAAKKAFIVTRIGDVGFLIAILYLFFQRDAFLAQGLNPFEIGDINVIAGSTTLAVTWLCLGIFAGAIGKSGQFPLHTWLPDAMEGPTPASALIHAATMVAAGVFLVVRFFPLFQQSDLALDIVALVGGGTALFAATMGLVMYDIKKVLAYSTISQLGYMMLAVGIGAPSLAIFHLFNHAFFKALLFLGAGNVSHATGTFDMRYMGGLRRSMPITYATFLTGALSLVGVFPLAGFWSKDEILLHAWEGPGFVDRLVFLMGVAGVGLTAFYMFRVIFMTFHGQFRGEGVAEQKNHSVKPTVHLSEPGWAMVVPLLVLSICAVSSGYLASPRADLGIIPMHWMVEFLGGHVGQINIFLAGISSTIVLIGIALAALMYQTNAQAPRIIGRSLRPLRELMFHKYYLDELYERVVVDRIFFRGLAGFLDWVDRNAIDKFGDDFVGAIGRNAGRAIAPIQNGQIQTYGIFVSVGVLVIMGVYLFLGR